MGLILVLSLIIILSIFIIKNQNYIAILKRANDLQDEMIYEARRKIIELEDKIDKLNKNISKYL